jgi:hypothetical protein
MTKITYEGPDGTETREFGREELTINSDTGFIEFQISDGEGDSITKHIPRGRLYSIEETSKIEKPGSGI